MAGILILNGSPRAPRSNSHRYAELFAKASPVPTETVNITRTNHGELCAKAARYHDVLLVFPLYADGIPVSLLNFLKSWQDRLPPKKPRISVLINCGFYEPEQNDVAVAMIEQFCRRTGCTLGAVLKIGSGEAILDTPFVFLVRRRIRALAAAVTAGRPRVLQVTMPIPKRLFVAASAVYWENYGRRSGISKRQMQSMDIEAQPPVT